MYDFDASAVIEAKNLFYFVDKSKYSTNTKRKKKKKRKHLEANILREVPVGLFQSSKVYEVKGIKFPGMCVCLRVSIYVYLLSAVNGTVWLSSTPNKKNHMCLKLVCFHIVSTLSTHLVGNPLSIVFWAFLMYINDRSAQLKSLMTYSC